MTICHNYSTRKTKLFLKYCTCKKKSSDTTCKLQIKGATRFRPPDNHSICNVMSGFREGNLPYRHASTRAVAYRSLVSHHRRGLNIAVRGDRTSVIDPTTVNGNYIFIRRVNNSNTVAPLVELSRHVSFSFISLPARAQFKVIALFIFRALQITSSVS